jgi:hypothetical protein
MITKAPAKIKGPLFSTPEKLVFVDSDAKLSNEYAVVFKNDLEVRAYTISKDDLLRCTAKGKRAVPEGYTIVGLTSLGLRLKFSSARKKDKDLLTKDIKPGKLGQKGIRLALAAELAEGGIDVIR